MDLKAAIIEKAKLFTIEAHASIAQKRKYTDEPYHVHSERVAALVATVTDDTEMIIAAFLHDVLEDVAPKNPLFDASAIQEAFGNRVLQLVLEVTDVSTLKDGNRAKRKALDRAHLAKASIAGKTIKLADLIDNLIDITKHDPNFAKIFKKEAELLLPDLIGGNECLYTQLLSLIERKT